MTDAVTLRQQLGKPPKQKACGPDKVLGFWIKELTNIHENIIAHLNKFLENGKTPEWMTKGRTCLILKDKKKGNETSNFWPTLLSPIMWIMERENLLLDEHRSCRRQSRGTEDQIMIVKMRVKELQEKNVLQYTMRKPWHISSCMDSAVLQNL